MSNLTPKQLAFVTGYLETGNASEAYRRAYNCSKMKPESVNQEAFKLLQHPKIAPIVEAAKSKALESAEVTVERITQGLADLAFKDFRPVVNKEGEESEVFVETKERLKSLEVLAKVNGMFKDGDSEGVTVQVIMEQP